MSQDPETHPTYPGLDEEPKILNFFGIIQLDKNRGTLAFFVVFFYTLAYYYVAPLLGLSGTATALALGPVALATVVVSLYRHRGHHLEWWAWQWIKNLRRPSVLLFRRRDEGNPLKKVRDSVQDALRVEEIEWWWIQTTDGVYLMVLRVMPYAVSLASREERRSLWRKVARYYRSIDFPVIELAQNREGSTESYQRDVSRAVEAELRDTAEAEVREALRDYAEAHLSFSGRITADYGLYDRSAYLMIPYDPAVEAGEGSAASLYDPRALLSKVDRGLFRRPNARGAAEDQKRDEHIARQMLQRAELVADLMASIGCSVELLADDELLGFFASQSTGYREDPEHPPALYEPITLESGGYEKLSEKQRRQVIEAAEEVRRSSPPSVGTATLAVRDRVSPDAVVRRADSVEVGGRHHKTRYISRYCDDVQLGILRRLEAEEARISVVKFVDPRPQEEGVKAYGRRLGELNAAARTDTDGSEITRNQKATARERALIAMNEVQNGSQDYLRVSLFIHLEADTKEGLEALDYRVFSILEGLSIETRVAREEAWEAFLTRLPLGRNYLSASTELGLLSGALACLFSFTTPNLQHEGRGAILLGLDLSADGQPIMYDDWRMPRPGSLTLGPPDTGKTYKTKADSTRKRLIGDRVVVLDPAANSYYGAVARSIGGVLGVIAVGSPHKINPFDLHDDYMSLGLLTDAIAESVADPEEVERRARAYALDGKVTALEGVIRLIAGGLSDDEAPVVQSALYRCYELAGITREPDTHAEEPPTFSGGGKCDFFPVLRGMEGGEDGETVKGLLRKLRSWESGPLATLFDSQTTIDVHNKYLVLQVASVDERAKPAVMAAVMECTSGVLSNPDERAHFYCDEAHELLYDEASGALGDWTRTGRVRSTSVHLISQNTKEFTDTHQGEVIRDNVGTVFLFNQGNDRAAATLAEIYGLSEHETEDLQALDQGQCYLLAGQSRHKVQVLASPEEDALFDTSPGSDRRRRERQAAEVEEAERRERETEPHPGVHVPEEYIPPASPELPRSDSAQDSAGGAPEDDTAEVPVAEEPDTTEIPTGGASEAGALPPLPGESGEEPTRIYAFNGEGSARAAAEVAKLLGTEAQSRDLRVLAVDAALTELGDELGVRAGSPDPYLQEGEADLETLGVYVAGVPEYPALMYVAGPAATYLSAAPLREAATRIFDVIVVACPGSASVYSAEWLLAADRVVGCSPERAADALECALAAERARGTNATILATTHEAADAADLGAGAGDRALFASITGDENTRLRLTTNLIAEKEEEAHE